MKFPVASLYFLIGLTTASGQTSFGFADSIRVQYAIPELAYAVVSADTIFELQTIGWQRDKSGFAARANF